MSRYYNDELDRTQRAVDKAAIEVETNPDDIEDDIEEAETTNRPPMDPDNPDLVVTISASPEHGRYTYQMVDNVTGLSHRGTKAVPQTNDTALVLLGIFNSLKSVLKSRITRLLMEKYGYSSLSATLSSKRRLHVRLVVTDPQLAELGRFITDPANGDSLIFMSMNAATKKAWQFTRSQTKRFDISWGTIATDSPQIAQLEQWADKVLERATHPGPVFSPTIKRAMRLIMAKNVTLPPLRPMGAWEPTIPAV